LQNGRCRRNILEEGIAGGDVLWPFSRHLMAALRPMMKNQKKQTKKNKNIDETLALFDKEEQKLNKAISEMMQ
jgi:hypothetical protein